MTENKETPFVDQAMDIVIRATDEISDLLVGDLRETIPQLIKAFGDDDDFHNVMQKHALCMMVISGQNYKDCEAFHSTVKNISHNLSVDVGDTARRLVWMISVTALFLAIKEGLEQKPTEEVHH